MDFFKTLSTILIFMSIKEHHDVVFWGKKLGRSAPRNPVFSGVEVPGEAEILKIFKLMWVKKKLSHQKKILIKTFASVNLPLYKNFWMMLRPLGQGIWILDVTPHFRPFWGYPKIKLFRFAGLGEFGVRPKFAPKNL